MLWNAPADAERVRITSVRYRTSTAEVTTITVRVTYRYSHIYVTFQLAGFVMISEFRLLCRASTPADCQYSTGTVQYSTVLVLVQ